MLRCIGEVVRVTTKSGTSKTGNPYRIDTARVLVGRADFVDVQLGRDATPMREGDTIDVAVEFSGLFNGAPQFTVRGAWADLVGRPAASNAYAPFDPAAQDVDDLQLSPA